MLSFGISFPRDLPFYTQSEFNLKSPDRAFEFQKRGQLFIRTHNEAVTIAAMRVSNREIHFHRLHNKVKLLRIHRRCGEMADATNSKSAAKAQADFFTSQEPESLWCFANRVADVAHCMDQRRIAHFSSQASNENIDQLCVVFMRVPPDAFA